MIGTSVSRAPVLYNLEKLQSKTQAELNAEVEKLNDSTLELLEKQLADEEDQEQEQEQAEGASRTKVSGQPGFAQRYMEKFGWQKGQGLGANKDGIKTAIKVAKAKRKVGAMLKAHKDKGNMGAIIAPKK